MVNQVIITIKNIVKKKAQSTKRQKQEKNERNSAGARKNATFDKNILCTVCL